MNKFTSFTRPLIWVVASVLALLIVGCGSGGGSADNTAPTVGFVAPVNVAIDVALNTNVIVNFSEMMDPSSLTTATFTLMQGTTVVPGAVTYEGTTATFNPTSNLAASLVYTATVTAGVRDLAGNTLATDYTWTFTTGTTVDAVAPTISSKVPEAAATSVSLNSTVVAIFSESMDPSTVTSSTFTLMQGTTVIPGAVAYVGTTATFTPASAFSVNTVYTATVTTGALDLAGNALAANATWTFTTGAVADTTAPTVIATVPVDAATGFAINANLSATFSEVMMPSTISATTFTLMQGTAVIPGTVSYVGRTATFNPTSALTASTVYTAMISTGVKDLAGNALAANATWTFTTGAVADTTPPTVSSTVPADVATGVAVNANVTAVFSESMDPSALTTATFTLKQGATAIPGAVTYLGTTATFNPTANLTSGTAYTATITSGAKDLAGNALASNKVWSFTTGVTAALGPAPVVLGTAGNYAILAETLISTTTTAGTAIVGDVGISPAAATFIQGFSLTLHSSGCYSTPTPATLVTGKLYAADNNTNGCPTPANLTTAIGDMVIAYTDAAGRTLPDHVELGAGDISGMTLAPGLYKWGTGVSINSNITLNGGPNDVWIFQVAGNLTMANATRMVLAGGALPKNIFWQVAGGVGVALGTTAHFEGVILATKAITLNTGANGNGRLLAQTAVTLDSNAVTQPAP